jgi:hypothetical protein
MADGGDRSALTFGERVAATENTFFTSSLRSNPSTVVLPHERCYREDLILWIMDDVLGTQ